MQVALLKLLVQRLSVLFKCKHFIKVFVIFPSFFLIHICVHTLRILYQAEVGPPLTVIILSVNSPIKDRDFQNG